MGRKSKKTSKRKKGYKPAKDIPLAPPTYPGSSMTELEIMPIALAAVVHREIVLDTKGDWTFSDTGEKKFKQRVREALDRRYINALIDEYEKEEKTISS